MFEQNSDVELIAEAVARRVIEPLVKETSEIKTLLKCHVESAGRGRDRFWKIVALGMSGPAMLWTVIQLAGRLF